MNKTGSICGLCDELLTLEEFDTHWKKHDHEKKLDTAERAFENQMLTASASSVYEQFIAARMIAIEAIAKLEIMQQKRIIINSFDTVSWACGHKGGAACVQCFTDTCKRLQEALKTPPPRVPDTGNLV